MKTIIRSIDKESHARATALTLALIKGEANSRTGLNKRNVANPFYTEDFDNGLIVCEYYQRADLGEKTWHGIMTDIRTDTIFCFTSATLAEVRLQCTRVIKNRFEAEQDEQEEKKEVQNKQDKRIQMRTLLTRAEAIAAVEQKAVEAVETEHCTVTNLVGYNGRCQGDDMTQWHADHTCTYDGDDANLRAIYYTTNEQDDAIEAAGGDGAAIDWEVAGYQLL